MPGNSHKPSVRKDPITGKLFVVNSDWWKIVGIEQSNGNYSPKDHADNYIEESQVEFKEVHELNTALSVHPSGKLGFNESTVLYRDFDNISEDHKNIFYPYAIESFVQDKSVYHGYMRKWDNGLLEYDLTFKLGYISTDIEDGMQLISANNLDVPYRNNNYLYFKTDEDMKMFNKGGIHFTNANGMRQVNLKAGVNAFSTKINFIEPFRDLDYMVFTSGVKNIETEAYDVKNEVLSGYDSRFAVEGLDLVGVVEGSNFKTEATIPKEIVNICPYALQGIDGVDGYNAKIKMLSGSNLVNISQFAFQ